jgi:hypothetical protein
MTPPAIIKTEFYAGPKDGDCELVHSKQQPRYYDARDIDHVHVYVYDGSRNRMMYDGFMLRDAASGRIYPLVIGQRN